MNAKFVLLIVSMLLFSLTTSANNGAIDEKLLEKISNKDQLINMVTNNKIKDWQPFFLALRNLEQ